jgi:hypothetical protein
MIDVSHNGRYVNLNDRKKGPAGTLHFAILRDPVDFARVPDLWVGCCLRGVNLKMIAKTFENPRTVGPMVLWAALCVRGLPIHRGGSRELGVGRFSFNHLGRRRL